MKDRKNIIVIGGGFSGLSTAAFLAKKDMNVTLIEKNKNLGGRARRIQEKGYSFDMGPSWYWMPEIFNNFFSHFNYKVDDLYELIKLDPGFKMIFKDHEIPISADWDKICLTFESYEKNGRKKLEAFMQDAKKKYNIGIEFIYQSPGISFLELLTKNIIKNFRKFQILTSYKKHVRNYFNHPYLIHILEFPILFLGSSSDNTPALYSLMAYSGIKEGTFYPMGGFHQVIKSMQKICEEQGVQILTETEIDHINIKKHKAHSVSVDKKNIKCDILICSADYQHIEQKLLDKEYRNYSKRYWQERTFAPSALIFYIGVKERVNKLEHHNLFFDEDISQHIDEIYKYKEWPSKPLFYLSCTSKTDPNVAPKDHENIFILIPIANGIEDTPETREKYYNIVISRLEKYCNQKIKEKIDYKKSYCIKDFIKDYNAYKGNAYGLANTLSQTANLKPKIYNKKVSNLFYTGQLTVPGPGVPPSIISGQIVSEFIIKKSEEL